MLKENEARKVQHDEYIKAQSAVAAIDKEILELNRLISAAETSEQRTQASKRHESSQKLIKKSISDQVDLNKQLLALENDKLKITTKIETSKERTARIEAAQIAKQAQDKFNRLESDDAKFIESIIKSAKTEVEIINGKFDKLSEIHSRSAEQDAQIRMAELALLSEFEAEKTRIEDEEQRARLDNMQQRFIDARNITSTFQSFESAIFDGKRARLDEELRNSKGMSAEQIKAKENEARQLFNNQKNANLAMIAINTGAAVMSEYAKGGPLAALAAGAAGIAQLAAVNATSYKSPVQASTSSGGPAQETAQQQSVKHEFNITSNIQDDANFTGTAVKSIIEQFQEELNNGGQMPT